MYESGEFKRSLIIRHSSILKHIYVSAKTAVDSRHFLRSPCHVSGFISMFYDFFAMYLVKTLNVVLIIK